MNRAAKLIIFSSFFVAACGDQNVVDKEPEVEAAAKSDGTLYDVQLDALEKAKGVEQALQKATQEREETMRKQSQ